MKTGDIRNEITLLHDTTEVSKRSAQFILLSLMIASAIVPLRFFEGHYISAATLAVFCILLVVLWLMYKKGYSKYTTGLTIVGINFFLTLFCFTDGLKMGGYLYFFPMMFALPFLISNKKKYTKEVFLYFIFIAACFCTCVFFAKSGSPWQTITEEQYSKMFYVNCISAVFLSGLFAYLGIYFERKYAQALLEQKNRTEEAMKARSQFLSQMGHELRTPLNGIIGVSNLLTKKETLPEQNEYLNILKYCSNHMLELINNILDYNKIEAGKLEIHLIETNLKQLLQNSVLPFHNRFEEKQLELIVEIDEALDETVLIDDIRMIQILNNLISNALKFTEKGYVRLKVACIKKEEDTMEVCFSVKDTGIGIDKKDYHKVFESFEQVYSASTRQYQGTGLGLNISQSLLRLMNSKLELESEPGKGSNFFFNVSLTKTVAKKTQHSNGKLQNDDLGGMRILIAEDNVINMLIAKKIMEDWNVFLTTAENGVEALESLRSNANYNIILLDLEMPEMDGYTAVKEIKKLYPSIPVLAFTAALIDQKMYSDLRETGFADAVLKPYEPMELFSKIRQYAN